MGSGDDALEARRQSHEPGETRPDHDHICVVGHEPRPLLEYQWATFLPVGRIFGIGKPARTDGTYKSGMLAYVDAGKRYAAAQVTTTLSGGRSRGSFTGKLLTGEAVTGTFRCS